MDNFFFVEEEMRGCEGIMTNLKSVSIVNNCRRFALGKFIMTIRRRRDDNISKIPRVRINAPVCRIVGRTLERADNDRDRSITHYKSLNCSGITKSTRCAPLGTSRERRHERYL